ncbi:hypothetical protein BDR05DRAFT_953821 [Suillus weaverae]|nr:hypothetical protein BDR05DRAFT_953821 [Suillus weaverae]
MSPHPYFFFLVALFPVSSLVAFKREMALSSSLSMSILAGVYPVAAFRQVLSWGTGVGRHVFANEGDGPAMWGPSVNSSARQAVLLDQPPSPSKVPIADAIGKGELAGANTSEKDEGVVGGEGKGGFRGGRNDGWVFIGGAVEG